MWSATEAFCRRVTTALAKHSAEQVACHLDTAIRDKIQAQVRHSPTAVSQADSHPFYSRRNVTTSTSRGPADGSSGSTGVTPCITLASSTRAASNGCVSVKCPAAPRQIVQGDPLAMLRRHQQHQHIIHTIAVHPLGRRPPRLAAARLDAELVQLDMPGFAGVSRANRSRQMQHSRQHRTRRRYLRHRIEPARDAAVQRVVVPALVMRLVRPADDPAGPTENTACRRFR